jgi:Ion channel
VTTSVWPAILLAVALFLVNLTLQALAAAGVVRAAPALARRVVPGAPFGGTFLILGGTLLALLVATLAQAALWAAALLACGEFADYEEAFYHSAVNFTTLGYGDIVMSRRWRLLGPLEAINGSLMLGLSAAMLFAVFGRVAEARSARDAGPGPETEYRTSSHDRTT